MNLVFYDTENTGTDTTFVQILQFAAILTDADLNERGRFEGRCRLLPHVIPAPASISRREVRFPEIRRYRARQSFHVTPQ